jgi:hypothetical protein
MEERALLVARIAAKAGLIPAWIQLLGSSGDLPPKELESSDNMQIVIDSIASSITVWYPVWRNDAQGIARSIARGMIARVALNGQGKKEADSDTNDILAFAACIILYFEPNQPKKKKRTTKAVGVKETKHEEKKKKKKIEETNGKKPTPPKEEKKESKEEKKPKASQGFQMTPWDDLCACTKLCDIPFYMMGRKAFGYSPRIDLFFEVNKIEQRIPIHCYVCRQVIILSDVITDLDHGYIICNTCRAKAPKCKSSGCTRRVTVWHNHRFTDHCWTHEIGFSDEEFMTLEKYKSEKRAEEEKKTVKKKEGKGAQTPLLNKKCKSCKTQLHLIDSGSDLCSACRDFRPNCSVCMACPVEDDSEFCALCSTE